MKLYKYTEEQLRDAVINSTSLRQTLLQLNVAPYGGNYAVFKEGVFKHACMNCRRTKWNHQPIPLELDHIDGNNQNNRLENLRLLCPNCHALTPTYRSRNRSKA